MLPFSTSRFMGLSLRGYGTALPGEEGIRLIFKDAREHQRLLKTELDSTLIRWANLQELKVDRGWLKDHVILQVRDPQQLGKLPALSDGQIVLDIAHRHREALAAFERQAAAFRSGQLQDPDDDELDEFIEDVRDMLDEH